MTVYTLKNNFNLAVVFSLLMVMVFYPLSEVFAEESGASVTTAEQSASTSSQNALPTTPVALLPVVETPGLQSVVSTTSALSDTHGVSATTSPVSSDATTSESFSTLIGGEGVATTSASTSMYEMTSSTTAGTTTATGEGVFNNGSSTNPLSDTTIVSGTSVAMANVLNLVNTNFVNSNGVIVFKNFFDTILDNFDLRSLYNSMSGGCSFVSCSEVGVKTSITNGATIDNDLSVIANSGGNTIDTSGHAVIRTGDAYAGVNLINVANTNVIDSNYLLVTMNAFKDVNGDIVFPSLSKFFTTLGGGASPSALSINNTAELTNNVALTTDTGNNTTTGAHSSAITTGESSADTNVFNQINTSLVGGQSVSILFRVHGRWAGEVFGAPANLGWLDDGKGGIYLFDTQGTPNSPGKVQVAATNTVAIHNNVSVVALTGDNAISGSETALISTGNAYAGANIVNVANATVVGRNWILAVINIFGDFKGNIAFGRPDLWIGGKVAVPTSVTNGSDLKYTLTVINNGDSPASKVTLTDTIDAAHLDIHDASLPYTRNEHGSIVWQLPDLAPGKATEITYYGRVKSADYSTDITSTVTVGGHETDNNRIDNTDTITVTTDAPVRSGSHVHISVSSQGGSSNHNVPVPTTGGTKKDIGILRLTASSTVDVKKGGKATQHLVLKNNTSKIIPGVVLHDILKDPSGAILKDEPWELGSILPKEEINISYDINFAVTAKNGLYNLDTHIESSNGIHAVFAGNGTILVVSSVPVLGLGIQKSLNNFLMSKNTTFGSTPTSALTRNENDERVSTTTVVAQTQFSLPPTLDVFGKQQALAVSTSGIPFRYSLYFMLLALLSIAGLRYYIARAAANPQQTSPV